MPLLTSTAPSFRSKTRTRKLPLPQAGSRKRESMRSVSLPLAVGFQEVVHLVRTEDAEVAKLQRFTERPDEQP